MYWCDAGTNRIESADLNGNHRIEHLNTGTNLDIHPFDLGILYDSIIWSDWAFRKLLVSDIQNPGFARLIGGNDVFRRGGGLHVYESKMIVKTQYLCLICGEIKEKESEVANDMLLVSDYFYSLIIKMKQSILGLFNIN